MAERKVLMLALILAATLVLSAGAQATEVEWSFIDSGPVAPVGLGGGSAGPEPAPSATMLHEVPTSTWTYGCSATSAGMMFGYYDRHGYADMYTGPANGGVAPLVDLGQGINVPIPGSCSIIATQNGYDGRTTAGHVDDYWISYGSAGPDPWVAGGVEHTWADCTADYMGTNQWKWDVDGGGIDYNTDGSTVLWSNGSATKLFDYIPPASHGLPQTALCHGLRLFAESRNYTVVQNYTQKIDTLYPGGFSFGDYMAEIDAGRPVMLQISRYLVGGHSMVGVGYDTVGQTVYLHDTWDNLLHSMTWGGAYSNMDHQAMTVIELAPLSAIPEPFSLIFFGTGLMGVAGFVARRRIHKHLAPNS